MAIDLDERIRSYAAGHVGLIMQEYNSQREKWLAYHNTAADSLAKAVANMEGVMTKSARKHEVLDQLAMLGLSLLAGYALGAMAAAIETKLYPRFAGVKTWVDRVRGGKYQAWTKYDYNEVAAKYWGDGIKKVVEDQLDRQIARVVAKAPQYKLNPLLAGAIVGGDVPSFKTQLDNQLHDDSQIVLDMLGYLAGRINQDRGQDQNFNFPKAVLDEVKRRWPSAMTQKDEDRERLAYEVLDKYFDALRKEYAKAWIYYANDPVTDRVSQLPRHLEIEVWRMWILDQDFKIGRPPQTIGDTEIGGGDEDVAIGKDGTQITYDILNHLVNDLGITVLYDVFWNMDKKFGTSFSERFGSTPDDSVSDQDDLDIVLNWARNHIGLVSVLDIRERVLPPITQLDKMFPRSGGKIPYIAPP
jgi:hypothetical protein